MLIVSGGFGGLLAAAQLRRIGVQCVRIVEAGSDVGGRVRPQCLPGSCRPLWCSNPRKAGPKRYGVRAADLVRGLIDTAILPERMRALAPPDGMWRIVPTEEVAHVVWAAYHGDLLVREERAKLPVLA